VENPFAETRQPRRLDFSEVPYIVATHPKG
jgi:hypothetical protein